MRSRCRANKPSIALWMLVAIGDLVLLVASVGVVALIALVGVVSVAAGAVGGWLVLRRGGPSRNLVPARATGVVSSRSSTGAMHRRLR
ncbi:hypothetical protein [Plantactinospora sp. B5E13]|uniref:hypothetical protein n=1 Tax=unclassified Plantactinospora TaxID=2631981 RepID=UPI00325CE58B